MSNTLILAKVVTARVSQNFTKKLRTMEMKFHKKGEKSKVFIILEGT